MKCIDVGTCIIAQALGLVDGLEITVAGVYSCRRAAVIACQKRGNVWCYVVDFCCWSSFYIDVCEIPNTLEVRINCILSIVKDLDRW